jgi:5'-nucleotidase
LRILLTNDDGVYAPGLRALRTELLKLGEVTVVAPATEQSAVGHSITLLNPLLVQQVFDDRDQLMGWAVEGRPADCVKLALLELLPEPPDVVVSGLNAGANAGINVLYSGTVAAAIEQILSHHPEPGNLFNVNIPNLEKGPVRGVRVLPQNVAPYLETFDRRRDPRGRVYFWSNPGFCCPEPQPDTDVTALEEGYVTVTPLQFDLTHAERLRAMQTWSWRL